MHLLLRKKLQILTVIWWFCFSKLYSLEREVQKVKLLGLVSGKLDCTTRRFDSPMNRSCLDRDIKSLSVDLPGTKERFDLINLFAQHEQKLKKCFQKHINNQYIFIFHSLAHIYYYIYSVFILFDVNLESDAIQH